MSERIMVSDDQSPSAYYISARELAQCGADQIPEELVSSKHLIYSSPAALAFNSPGAQGFGVKRAALAIPGSVMLLAAPGCCGRNTTIYSELEGYENRFFYLLMDETDIVTGRHLKKIPRAVTEIYNSLETKPAVVMICITCVDALLGTDMERVCRKASKEVGIPVLPCYMYALTREGRKPPMVHVQQSIYTLLEKRKTKGSSVNILGYFAPLEDNSELYELLHQIGIKKIREISRCRDFEEYMDMAEANFNLVLNPEARFAASDISKRLGIPYIELARIYQIEKIKKQYALLAAALGVQFEDGGYYEEAADAIDRFKEKYPELIFSVGEGCNANAFELSLALLRYGFAVAEIFADPQQGDFAYIKRIAQLSPDTRIYSNLEPSMLYYDGNDIRTDITIGKDAAYYHPDRVNVEWSDDVQPFGYRGVVHFFEACDQKLREAKGGFIRILTGGPTAALVSPFTLKKETKKNKTKNLRKFIAPYAPDQSGAAAMLCELGGMVIILDAGGCAGNICGFDEPRWFGSKSAIFSAGLRDMDAILGRDEHLVEKVGKACKRLNSSFIAIIGTPVPSVIGTDYRALKRMIEQKTGLPVITVDTNGTELYDAGIQKAMEAVFKTFTPQTPAQAQPERIPGSVGILGASPLDIVVPPGSWESTAVSGDSVDYSLWIKYFCQQKGYKEVICFGMGEGVEAFRKAHRMEKNIVIAPAALSCARYMKDNFGIPYETGYPLETLSAWPEIEEQIHKRKPGRILIVHQQILANALRDYILSCLDAEITVASWFELDRELCLDGDIHLKEEEQWIRLAGEGQYDMICGDFAFFEAIPDYDGIWVDIDHFAVSGRR